MAQNSNNLPQLSEEGTWGEAAQEIWAGIKAFCKAGVAKVSALFGEIRESDEYAQVKAGVKHHARETGAQVGEKVMAYKLITFGLILALLGLIFSSGTLFWTGTLIMVSDVITRNQWWGNIGSGVKTTWKKMSFGFKVGLVGAVSLALGFAALPKAAGFVLLVIGGFLVFFAVKHKEKAKTPEQLKAEADEARIKAEKELTKVQAEAAAQAAVHAAEMARIRIDATKADAAANEARARAEIDLIRAKMESDSSGQSSKLEYLRTQVQVEQAREDAQAARMAATLKGELTTSTVIKANMEYFMGAVDELVEKYSSGKIKETEYAEAFKALCLVAGVKNPQQNQRSRKRN